MPDSIFFSITQVLSFSTNYFWISVKWIGMVLIVQIIIMQRFVFNAQQFIDVKPLSNPQNKSKKTIFIKFECDRIIVHGLQINE